MKLTELAKALGESCELGGHADPEVSGVSSPRLATAAALVFAEDEASLAAALDSGAAAVAVKPGMGDAAAGKKEVLGGGGPQLGVGAGAEERRAEAGGEGVA